VTTTRTTPSTSGVLTPDEVYAEFRRAEDFLASGRPADAARIVAPVVELDPSHLAAVELLARAYYDSAQLTRAEAALRRLVELAPSDGWARLALARVLERQSRGGEAAPHRRVAEALGWS